MVPRTIENTRELDETVCLPDDEEVFPYSCLILQVNREKYVVSFIGGLLIKYFGVLPVLCLKLFAGNDVDEFSAVLRNERTPKTLITTSRYNSTVSLYILCFPIALVFDWTLNLI